MQPLIRNSQITIPRCRGAFEAAEGIAGGPSLRPGGRRRGGARASDAQPMKSEPQIPDWSPR